MWYFQEQHDYANEPERLAFEEICNGHLLVSLGACSNAYVRCSYNSTGHCQLALLEECPIGKVLINFDKFNFNSLIDQIKFFLTIFFFVNLKLKQQKQKNATYSSFIYYFFIFFVDFQWNSLWNCTK